MRKVMALFAVCVFVVGGVYAGGARKVNTSPLMVDKAGMPQVKRTGNNYVPGLDNATSITWVAADTMANAFGPASRGVKPLAYDPGTGALALIHRGAVTYAASAGELWYNLSHDGGNTWRRVGALNNGAANLARYPSCAIANPSQSADTSNALFVYAAPELQTGGSAFGDAMFGVDAPLGGGFATASQVTGDPALPFWSNAHIWGAIGSPEVNWVMYRSNSTVPNDLYRWSTTDFVTITQGVPSTWLPASFDNGAFGLDIVGAQRNGTHYFGKWGTFTGDLNQVDNVGYSTSTNGGITWSAWTRPLPDWRTASGLGLNYDWWTYGGPGAFSFDMVVDAQNKVHYFGVVQDTATFVRSLVEVYETASGWGSKIIQTNLSQTVVLSYPAAAGALNQMGNHLNAAITAAGDVMALVWLDGGTPSETMTDIWFTWRRITDANWSTPINLTATPTFAELLLQAAPTLKTNGPNSWTMYLGRTYESGVTTYPPEAANPSVFYTGQYTWTATSVGDQGLAPQKFSLAQNYPNPFNPATKIEYSVAQSGHVMLRVFDLLGKEVGTLVNENKQPGSYHVTFDASSLPSGVYMYQLNAGAYKETKKMLLVK